MGISPVISGLKRKRAVLSGELLKAEKRCEAMRLHLAALDQTLRLMGYDGNPEDIKPVQYKRRLFGRGELQRRILDVLRTADGPVSDAEMTDHIMAVKAWDAANVDLRRTLVERVKAVRKRLAQ